MPAQDPDEPFDLTDRDGNLLHRVKPRGLVHRDGDWHRALHLWVVLVGASGPRVVLQRRSLAKDTHPGLVDVSVAGHLRAGETAAEALRESEEEIGLAVATEDAVLLGHRRVEKVVPAGVDREVQTVLATVSDRALRSLRPHPEEVAALYAPSLADALAFARGERAGLPAGGVEVGGRVVTVTLTARDFIADESGYRRGCLERVEAHLRGAPFALMTLG